MLKEQSRVSRLSFADVIKRVSEYDKDHPAYISSHPTMVESYVIVHGQIILQQFSEYPDNGIKKNAFATGLYDKMEQRHQNKWLVKKKVVLKKEVNMNPRAAIAPLVSKRKAMPATTTRLINRIWGEYYLNSLPEDSKESSNCEIKEAAEEEEDVDHEEYGEEDSEEFEEKKMDSPHSMLKMKESGSSSNNDVRWDGEAMGQTPSGEAIYQCAIVCGESVNVGGFVLVDKEGFNEFSHICLVEYMYENSKGEKIIHGRLMMRGYHTVLGNTADDRELFLTNDCQEFEVNDFVENLVVETRMRPWGYQHQKANAEKDKADKERAEDRKHKGLSMEYFCRSLYWPERGAFFSLPVESMGLGNGFCHSCKLKEAQREKETFKVNLSMTGFTQNGIEYNVHDFVYLAPNQFAANGRDNETFKGGRNVGLKAYVLCQLLEIEVPNAPERPFPESTMVKVRRFYRPEDISSEKAYCSDIREVSIILSPDSIF
jgi:DNA (cytosine-5)-methyltransferase 1